MSLPENVMSDLLARISKLRRSRGKDKAKPFSSRTALSKRKINSKIFPAEGRPGSKECRRRIIQSFNSG